MAFGHAKLAIELVAATLYKTTCIAVLKAGMRVQGCFAGVFFVFRTLDCESPCFRLCGHRV